jgi:hypothetical protein
MDDQKQSKSTDERRRAVREAAAERNADVRPQAGAVGAAGTLEGETAASESELLDDGILHSTPRSDGGAVARGLQNAGDAGQDMMVTTRRVLKGAISMTEEVGTDLVGGVTHLAQEMIYGVRDIGGDAAVVVKDGARGTVDAVGDIGGTTLHTLTNLLVDVVGGVRKVAGAAVSGVRGTVAEARLPERGRTAVSTRTAEEEIGADPRVSTEQVSQQGASLPH